MCAPEVQTEILWTEDSLLSHCHQDGHKDPPSSNFIECDYHQSDPVVYGDQDVDDKDPLSSEDAVGQNVKDFVLECGPNSSATDRISGFKTELDVVIQQPEAMSEQSLMIGPSVDEINHCQPVCNNEAPHEDCSSETHIPDEPNLKRHFSFPNNEKLNVCKICQKKFANKFNLTRHMKVHNGEYECCVCHKIWFSKSDLSRHMAIHNGQKLYECDICEKRFSLQQNLAYHMRAHIGNQPYECQICKKKYTFKCHLTLHMKFHNGEKPYECKICHKNFTQRSDLNKHMRIHYQENQYPCGRCVKRFAQKSNLIRHMRQDHGFDRDNRVCQ
ncbi:zinc finger protein OZF-like [Artemia franciscana]|uniref:zinc finger protein OZF-like n=1 Tax=Artemia franciscana TaxID=6661 RepID=UPI0032DBA640